MEDFAKRLLDSLPSDDRQRVRILAERLKETYVRIMRKEKKKYRLDPSFNDMFWLHLAIKVNAIDGKAVGYMNFQFEYGPPFTDLYKVCSDQAVEQYRLEIQTDAPVRRADRKVQLQLKTVSLFMDAGRTLRQVLLNSCAELNPLVFYCLAVAGGLSDLAVQVGTQAAQFLMKYPEYRASTILGDLFVEPSEIPTPTPID